ncbi:MAG: stage II sporulation protein R [Mobilitalea sp.]
MKQYRQSNNIHINRFSEISEEKTKVKRQVVSLVMNKNEVVKDKITATKKDKFRVYLFLSILFFCTMTSMILMAKAKADENIQSHIANEIIRFHVIANSDSDEDQALKIQVKNALVQDLSPLLNSTNTIDEARSVLLSNLNNIQTIAERIIKNEGYYYPVTVTLENTYFPLKIYGEYSFPPGYYEALRVQIGSAEGQNWWCVMFPPLCFVDETYSIVDETSGDKLKHLLTEEEYNSLLNKNTPVKVKFKLWESIKNLFK